MKIAFSEPNLRALGAPAKGRLLVWSEDEPGFAVRVTSNGVKTFVVIKRPAGAAKPVTITLCRFNGKNLKAARKAADAALEQLANGKVPTQQKREAQAATLGVLAEQYLRSVQANKRHSSQVEGGLRREWLGQRRDGQGGWIDCPDRILRDRPAAKIERREIIARLDLIKSARGLHAARHAGSYISRLFNWLAAGHRGGVLHSPLSGLSLQKLLNYQGHELMRDRILSEDELRRVWHAAGDDTFGTLVRLLILTGQRRNDWARATWFEISGAELVIPKGRYKGRRDHHVPLCPGALRLLHALPRVAGCKWMFTNSGVLPFSNFSRAKRRLDRASGVTGWVLHDLRRTVRSHLPALGVSRDVSERLLGHAQHVLDQVYDHHDYGPQVRAALEAWEQRLAEIVAPRAALPAPALLLEAQVAE
jgi:integrase